MVSPGFTVMQRSSGTVSYTHLRERLIQLQMGRCIGGRIVITLYLIAFKVDNYHILRLQQIVLYSAGFDYKKTLCPDVYKRQPIHQFIITKSACIIKTYLINSQFLKYSRYINPLYSPTDLYYNRCV